MIEKKNYNEESEQRNILEEEVSVFNTFRVKQITPVTSGSISYLWTFAFDFSIISIIPPLFKLFISASACL